ncbi:MAG: hypothetical protein LBI67_04270 [Treponema sp.]|jgi:hypothetical protein|nr:hypothetical protein [Treponema sp.]
MAGKKHSKRKRLPTLSGVGGASYAVFGSPVFGLFFSTEFLFPKALVHGRKGEESRYELRNISTFNFQLGVIYRLVDNDRFKVPVGLGLHYFNVSGTATLSPTESTELAKYGLGFSASVGAEFHVNEMVYFFGRLQGSFDFITSTKWTKYTGVSVGPKMAYFIDSDEYVALSAHTELLPVIGIGLKMDGLMAGRNKKW